MIDIERDLGFEKQTAEVNRVYSLVTFCIIEK